MKEKKTNYKIKKEDFIDFLASASPEEVNKLILEKGKPRKLIQPLIFFDEKDKTIGDKA